MTSRTASQPTVPEDASSSSRPETAFEDSTANNRYGLLYASSKPVFEFSLLTVAICSYNRSMETGIRELKDNLSRYIRRIETGERVVITSHGRVVAELVPPGAGSRRQRSEFDRLVATGTITTPAEDGDPLEGCPEIRLPRGTTTALIDRDRGEA